MEKQKSWFKTRKVIASFAIVALTGGFLFLNHSITGNIILNDEYSFNLISIIGLMLILCSIILGVYSVRKK